MNYIIIIKVYRNEYNLYVRSTKTYPCYNFLLTIHQSKFFARLFYCIRIFCLYHSEGNNRLHMSCWNSWACNRLCKTKQIPNRHIQQNFTKTSTWAVKEKMMCKNGIILKITVENNYNLYRDSHLLKTC